MENMQSVAGGNQGHVRAIFSAWHGGFAVPCDLLRAHLRACNRLSAARHNAAMYARLEDFAANYLVSEPAVVAVVERPFSKNRWWHQAGGASAWRAGDFSSDWDYVPWVSALDRAAIDAPPAICAGGCHLLAVLKTGTRLAGSIVVGRGRE